MVAARSGTSRRSRAEQERVTLLARCAAAYTVELAALPSNKDRDHRGQIGLERRLGRANDDPAHIAKRGRNSPRVARPNSTCQSRPCRVRDLVVECTIVG
jgi:hypothetical protein